MQGRFLHAAFAPRVVSRTWRTSRCSPSCPPRIARPRARSRRRRASRRWRIPSRGSAWTGGGGGPAEDRDLPIRTGGGNATQARRGPRGGGGGRGGGGRPREEPPLVS